MIVRKQTVSELIEHVVADYHPVDITILAGSLPENIEEAASNFCDKFELGNWFYDAMVLNDVDIRAELNEIAEKRNREERGIES